MSSVMLLVDCNAFFCSCERLFDPRAKKAPVVVLSNNDGCAVSRTSEAKALGIKMGQPYFEFKHLEKNHGLLVYSSNFALYTDISKRVMSILRQEAQLIEIYSVDEAFLEWPYMDDLEKRARQLKERIFKEVGIPVSIGIGANKVLCKVATYWAKKSQKARGVVNLYHSGHLDYALKHMPVQELWGVGKRSALKYQALKIKSAYDLKAYERSDVILKQFTKLGRYLQLELQGQRCFELTLHSEPRKQILHSRSFSTPVMTKHELASALVQFVSLASKKMRDQHTRCKKLLIFARTSPFAEQRPFFRFSRERVFDRPVFDTFELIQALLELLEEAYVGGHEYKKAGVLLSDLHSEKFMAYDLFLDDDQRDGPRIELMKTMDQLHHYYQKPVVRSALSESFHQSVKMKRSHVSGAYTTSWRELKKCE